MPAVSRVAAVLKARSSMLQKRAFGAAATPAFNLPVPDRFGLFARRLFRAGVARVWF
jgi:hypothetical protein